MTETCEWCGHLRIPAVGLSIHVCDPRDVRRRALQDASAAAVGMCACTPCENIRYRIKKADMDAWEGAYGKDAVRPD